MRFPRLTGTVSIRDDAGKVVIGGDPDGLRSLGRLLTWLADTDLDQWPHLLPGGHAHVHLYPRVDMSEESRDVELLRLDPKGKGPL
jgi:hypothetical protein